MLMPVRIAICLAVSLCLAAASVSAAPVLCRKGVKLKVREGTCKGKETVLDLSQLGAVGPPGPPGAQGPRGLGLASPLVVPAAAFSDDGFSAGLFFFDFDTGALTGDDVGIDGCVKAPVTLPPGSTITALRSFLIDANGADTLLVRLWRVPHGTGPAGPAEPLAEASAAADASAIQEVTDSTVANGVISNSYAYYVTACVQPGLFLYSVHIDFTPPA
jgi:hypothetical protein